MRSLLDLELLHDSSVVAGHGGLDREVQTVTVGEVPDQATFLQGGEFVLTSLFAFKDDPAAIVDYVIGLYEGGAVALGYKPGRFVEAIPPDALQVADRLGFPIIEIPVATAWPDIISPVLRQLLADQTQLLQHSMRAHTELMGIALRGGDLQQITTQAMTTTGAGIWVFDSTFSLLASSDGNQLSAVILSGGEMAPDVVRRLKSSGLLRKMEVDRRPADYPDLEMPDGAAVLFPVVCKGEIYGYLFAVTADHSLSAIHRVTLEEAAMVIALELLKREAVQMASWQLEGDLLQDLIGGVPVSSADFARRARVLGMRPSRQYRMLALEVRRSPAVQRGSAPGGRDAARGRLSAAVRAAVSVYTSALVAVVGERIAIMIPDTTSAKIDAKRIAANVLEDLRRTAPSMALRIGIGSSCSELGAIPTSFTDAGRALAIGARSRPTAEIIDIAEVGVFDLLAQSSEVEQLRAFCDRTTAALREHDQRASTQLCETLAVYLENHQRVKETAASLFIHRNTLAERLARIRSITALDFDDPIACMNWQIALRLPPALGE